MSHPSASANSSLSSYFFHYSNSLQSCVDKKVERVVGRGAWSAAPLLSNLGLQAQQVAAHAHVERDPELISSEEILSYSLLNQAPAEIAQIKRELESHAGLFKGLSLKEAVIRLTANFLGGGLITGGNKKHELDGMQSLPNYPVWNWLITELYGKIHHTQCAEAPILQQMMIDLRKIMEYSVDTEKLYEENAPEERIYDTALKYATRVHLLKPNESEVFNSYWLNVGGGGGHALIYEIIRKEDGTFDLLFFTSTGFQLTDFFLAGNKTRLRPFVRYTQIPENYFLLNGDGVIRPAFIQSIMELSVLAKKEVNRVVDSEDVLQILDFIEPFRVPVAIEECGAITGQRAGTCVPSVTKAWLRNKSKHLGLYKQVMFHAKLKLMTATYFSLLETLSTDSREGETGRRLLEQLSRKLLRRCAKMLEGVHTYGPLINAELALQARATAHDILNHVAGFETAIALTRDLQSDESKLTNLNILGQCLLRKSFEHPVTIPPTAIVAKASMGLELRPLLNLVNNCAESLIDELNKTIEKSLAFKEQFFEKNKLLMTMQIHLLVDQIPLPLVKQDASIKGFKVEQFEAPFWKRFSLQQLITTQNLLHKLTLIYIKGDSFKSDLIPRQFATILPLQALIHFLALKIDAKKRGVLPINSHLLLENYQIPSFVSVLKLEGLLFLDRKEFERAQIAFLYFNEYNALPGVKDSLTLFQSEQTTEIVKTMIEKSPANGLYWKALLNSDHHLLTHVISLANTSYPDLSEDEIEREFQQDKQARLKSWADDVRAWETQKARYSSYQWDVQLYRTWSQQGRIGPEPKVNPVNDPGLLPERPKDPPRVVNLPLDTKLMIIMQRMNGADLEDDKPLERFQYHYVSILRKMTCLSYGSLYLHQDASREIMCCQDGRENRYTYDAKMFNPKYISSSKPSQVFADQIAQMHRSLENSHLVFLNKEATYRNEPIWKQETAEWAALYKFEPQGGLLHRILRTLSQWELTPNQLIYELGKEIKELHNPSLQALAMRLFFRSPILKNNSLELGAGNLILTDVALFENVRAFIDKGLTFILSSDEDISAGRFFFELSFYLSKYLVDAGFREKAETFNQLEEIKRWFDKKGLSDQDRSVLHLYRVLFYSLKAHVSDEDYANLFSSWAIYQLYPDSNNKWKSPFLEDYALRIMQARTALFFDHRELATIPQIGHQLFQRLNLDSDINPANWTIDLNLGIPYLSNGDWKLQLALGKIYGKLGEIQGLAKNFPWEKQDDFKRLFANEAFFAYRVLGQGCVTFTHSTKGIFRLIPKNTSGSVVYAIQKRMPGQEQWFEYCQTNELDYIPEPLKFDHAFWVPQNQFFAINQVSIKGLFTHLKSLKISHCLRADGVLMEANPITGAPNDNALHISYLLASGTASSLQRFDTFVNILLFHNPLETLEKIIFPRYRSLDGNLLMFLNQSGRMVWTENREFAIPLKMPKSHLGTISNYLYLESVNPENKRAIILIPFQNIKVDGLHIAEGCLDIENLKSLTPLSLDQKQNELKGLQKYFFFEIVNKEVIPTTIESKLFLAYIFLSQKKYEACVDLLRSLKVEFISPIGMHILEMIQELPLGEDHPDAKMVGLHALSLSIRQRDDLAKEQISSYFEETHSDIEKLATHLNRAKDILQSSNNISLKCRMEPREEAVLLHTLAKEGERQKHQLNRLVSLSLVLQMLSKRTTYLKSQQLTQITTLSIGSRKKDLAKQNTQFFSYPIDMFPSKQLIKPVNIHSPNYYSQLQSYLTQLSVRVQWLDNGAISDTVTHLLPKYQYTRISPTLSLYQNGKFFKEVYLIAKYGNIDQKSDLFYRLKMWRMHLSQSISILDFYLILLSFPERFPNFIDMRKATDEQKYNFLHTLQINYAMISSQTLPDSLSFRKKSDYNKSSNASSSSVNDDRSSPRINYSTPLLSAFDTKFPSISNLGAHSLPLNLTFSPLLTRWDTLQQWKSECMKDDLSVVSEPYEDFTFAFEERFLSDKEKTYKESLKHDLEVLQQDYDAGKAENNRFPLKSISKEKCLLLQNKVQDLLNEVFTLKKQKEAFLLKKANLKSNDPLVQQSELARIAGHVDAAMNFQDCIDCLLSFDRRKYGLKNKNLNHPSSVNEIADLTVEIVDLQSHESQLKRLLVLITQIDEAELAGNKATHRYLCQKLTAELDARYYFDEFNVEEQMILRVFCGQTGIIPFEKQCKLIKKMLEMEPSNPEKYRDIVIQLIMGGGKTSVIATILLFLSARRKGRLAFFIVPPSLFQTVTANLSESIFKAFGKNVLALNLMRDQYTPYKLEKTYNELMQARDCGQPVIISAITLQGLELEMLSLSRKIKKLVWEKSELSQEIQRSLDDDYNEVLENKQKDISEAIAALAKKCGFIFKILSLSEKNGDGLLDEVDLILDSFQELNFVDGEKVAVDPTRNFLLLNIYNALNNPTLKINTLPNSPLLCNVVKLQTNQQTQLSGQDFIAHVAPVIAQHLSQTFKPITEHLGTYDKSYIRYASGQIATELQPYINREEPISPADAQANPRLGEIDIQTVQMDLAFLKHLRHLYIGDENQKSAADLIAQSKHFLLELLPATLSKIGGRNYGVTPDKKQAGKIIPLLGVNTPATTEFGYHWEAGCYHYQWGSAFKPQEDQIFEIANLAVSAARYYNQKYGEKFEETAEYLEFFELFGVKLDEIRYPGKVEEAMDYIFKDPMKTLEMQYECISRFAKYASERLSSNGLALIDLLASSRTMSATPWNVEGYDERLAKRFEADIGTEGRILHKLAERANAKKIYEIDFESCHSNIKEFLQQIYTIHPSFKKIRGIIEAGGLFKVFGSNAAVARGWIDFISQKQSEEQDLPEAQKKVDPAIEAVLFFHTDKGEMQPNTLFVWRKGAHTPERIGKTTVAALEAKGLPASKFVVFYDEKHTTGTDILQLPEAINLLTFDEKMLMRTETQSAMRLRQHLFEQSVDIVTDKQIRHTLLNGGKNYQDLANHAAKTQSIRKTQSMIRYFTQQIHHIFRRHSVQIVRNAIAKEQFDLQFATTVDTFEKFFVTQMHEEPYLMHGSLESTVDTKKMLQNLLSQKLVAFQKSIKDVGILNAVQKDVEAFYKWIEQCKSLPSQWKDMISQIGVEQEVEQQLEVEIEVNVEVEIEREIEIELQRYEHVHIKGSRIENAMTLPVFKALIAALKSNPSHAMNTTSLKHQLSLYKYGFNGAPIPYQNAFNEPIFGTDSFFYSCQDRLLLPVFHSLQRPAKQILALHSNSGEYRWLLLSEHEANDVRKHLEMLYTTEPDFFNDVWLIQPDGTPLVQGKDINEFPKDDDAILKGMIEINAFTGNIDYLDNDNNREEAEEWLDNDPALKVRFLKLRTFRNQTQQTILRTSPLIARACGNDHKNIQAPVQYLCKKRLQRELNRKGSFKLNEEWEAKLLDSKRQIRDLHVQYVHLLGIAWEKRESDPVTNTALKKLDAKPHVISLELVAETLSKRQFESIAPFQGPYITPDQLRWLPVKKVAYLTNPAEQIVKKVTLSDGKKHLIYLLSVAQIKGLTEEQAHFVPYINPDYYQYFDKKWQIQAVSPTHLPKINPEFGYLLSEKQIKSIPDEYTKLIQSAQIQPLESAERFYEKVTEKLSPIQKNWLPIDRLIDIPKIFYKLFSEEQIQTITDTHLIPLLEELAAKGNGIPVGLWTSWISPSMVSHINTDQIKYLITRDQVSRLLPDAIPHLLNQQIQASLISRQQVEHLIDSQVPACPPALVCDLIFKQIPWLPVEKVAFLKWPQQIAHETLELEGDKTLKYLLTLDQTRGLVEGQENLIPWINPEFYASFNQIWQIQSIPTRYVIKINPDFGSFLTQVQIQAIPEEHAKHKQNATTNAEAHIFHAHLVGKLTPHQIGWLPIDRLDNIPECYVKHFNAHNIQAISAVHLIPQLEVLAAKANIAVGLWTSWIKPALVPYIRQDQIPHLITREQVSQIMNCDVPYLHPTKQVATFLISKDQVKFLTSPPQIQACPNPLVSELLPLQIKDILDSQVPYLSGKIQLQALDDQQLRWITSTQVKFLSNTQILKLKALNPYWESFRQYLTNQQIQTFNTEDLIALLTEQQIHDHLETFQVPFLKNERQIRACPQQHLNKLSAAQLDLFGSEGFNALTDAHVIWKRITTIAIRNINPEKIRNLQLDQLEHLEKPESIKAVAKWNFVHLKKDQLKHRKADFWTYLLGIITLGVVACTISLLAYTVFPLIWLCHANGARNYRAKLDKNIYRFSHFFKEYLPAYGIL